MSSKKARQRQKPDSAYARRSPAQVRKPFWRRSTLWAGGLGTAVTTGVLINVLTTQAQRVAQPPVPGPASSGMITPHAVPSSRVSARPTPTPSGPPLTVVSEDPLNIGQMVVWVFPNKYLPSTGQLHYINTLIEAPGLASRPAFNQWFYSHRAYEAGGSSTQLVVQNNRPHPIRIINMNVVKSCRSDLTGTLFFGAGGAVDATVGLGFDLDSTDTEAELAKGMGPNQWKPDYFAKYTILIEPGAQQVLDLWTTTTKQACSYEFQATVLDGSRKIDQMIQDGNEPFRATALNLHGPYWSSYRAVYIGGAGTKTGAFIRVNPRTQKPLN